MTAEHAIPSPVQLVFDTNILADAITARGHYYPYAVQVLEMVRRGEVEGWYAAHTLTTVYYLVEKTLAVEAQNRAQAIRAARAVVNKVFGLLKPLPQAGDEFLALDPQPGDDLEDLLIVKLAAQYLPKPLIVTRDKWMLNADRPWQAAHPKEIVDMGLGHWCARRPGTSLDFADLRTQQRMIWPALADRMRTVLSHGRYILGPEVGELEERLADYVGVKHCIGVSSGTDALLVAMMAMEIGAGDEVITTPFTFVATGEMIALLGAKPVFVDIDPRTYNIDPSLIEAAITPRTKVIMPVSLYGQCAEMDAINAVADRHGLPVIEDAAQSFGATYKGRSSCGLSTIGCTSFFPSKPLGCYGDGGACFTNDDALATRMRQISVHGQDRRYHHPVIGINGRLDTIQAAVLLAKLNVFPQEVEARARIGLRYSDLLANVAQTPYIEPYNTSVYAQYTIQVERRDEAAAQMGERGIPTAVHYPVPLTRQPALSAFAADTPVADAAAERVMSLPMSPWLSREDQDMVVDALSTLRR